MLGLLVLASTADAAVVTYNFAGVVNNGSASNNIPAGLQPTFYIGQPVTLSFVVDTATPESSNTAANANLAYYPGAVLSWTATYVNETYGSYTASGTGGYVTVCDSGTSEHCNTPYFPGPVLGLTPWDGVRFVGWSPDLMGPEVNGYDLCGPTNSNYDNNRQCVTANLFNIGGTAFTGQAIPPWLDPAMFTGPNNTRLNFTSPQGDQVWVGSNLRVIPEPGTLALLGLGLAGLAAARRRKQ